MAQYPLPILTGIGHERDDTVLDLVAHTRVKTPTAAAEFLISWVDRSGTLLEDLAQALVADVKEYLSSEKNRLQQLVAGLPMAYARRKSDEERMLDRFSHRLVSAASDGVEQRKHTLTLLEQRLCLQLPFRFQKERTRLDFLAQRIHDNSPERILARGYSITLKNGKAVTKATELEKGDVLTTRLSDGSIESKVL